MELSVYASGSSGNFYVARDGDHRIAIEAGIRYKEIQLATAFRVSSLEGCLVSHSHLDHARSVVAVASAGVDVYMSRECAECLKLPPSLNRIRYVMPHHEFVAGAFTVRPFDVVHDAPGTLGFIILGPSGRRLVYLTDTCYSPYRFGPCEIYALEANFSREIIRDRAIAGDLHVARHRRTSENHMSLERLIELLKANDLSRAEEIHLLHLSDGNSDSESFAAQVRAATGVPTYTH